MSIASEPAGAPTFCIARRTGAATLSSGIRHLPRGWPTRHVQHRTLKERTRMAMGMFSVDWRASVPPSTRRSKPLYAKKTKSRAAQHARGPHVPHHPCWVATNGL